MSEDLESQVAQALTDASGPPELAAQLLALYGHHFPGALIIPGARCLLLDWILFHTGEEWSAIQFDRWASKYKEVFNRLNQEEKF